MTDAADIAQVRSRILELVREHHRLSRAEQSAGSFGLGPMGLDERDLVGLVDAALDGALMRGERTRTFESRLARYLEIEHVLLVNSGSSANLLALSALTSDHLGDRRLKAGDEVVTVAVAHPTLVAPILQAGCVPVFTDVHEVTAVAMLEEVERAIGPKTKAIMISHTMGNPFPAIEMRKLADAHGLWLVEDNREALGSEYGEFLTGRFGHVSTCGFGLGHQLTMGQGGAVCVNDLELLGVVTAMRNQGRECSCGPGQVDKCGGRFSRQSGALPHGYDHQNVYTQSGFGIAGSDLQAAVGLAQLVRLEGSIAARRRAHAYLGSRLIERVDRIVLPDATPRSNPAWFGFVIRVRPEHGLPRERYMSALEDIGIHASALHSGNIVRQPLFDRMRETRSGCRVVGSLANTERFMRDAFWFGVHPGLTDGDLDRIVETIVRAGVKPKRKRV